MKLPKDFGGWIGLLLYALLVAVMIAYHPYVRGGEVDQRRLCAQQALSATQIQIECDPSADFHA